MNGASVRPSRLVAAALAAVVVESAFAWALTTVVPMRRDIAFGVAFAAGYLALLVVLRLLGPSPAARSLAGELRAHVLHTLCERDRLDPECARLRQAPVRRGGRTCGLFFQVQGPRQLRTYALWAGEEHRILFYDSTGERFAETCLSDAPDPQTLAA